MKFVYQYRTSDNVKHTGVVAAATRDAAFADLKDRGIRAFGVEEAPGFFNKLWGKGKRWLAIGLLGSLALVCIVLLTRKNSEAAALTAQLATLDSGARRPLIGDTAFIELGIRTGWTAVFTEPGDQFLASFAIPGVPAGRRTVPESLLRQALAHTTPVEPGDGIEARQLKGIVNAMKDEINDLLRQGWTLSEVGRSLAKRQDLEISYFVRAQNEIDVLRKAGAEETKILACWQEQNAQLRKMGIRALPFPEEPRE